MEPTVQLDSTVVEHCEQSIRVIHTVLREQAGLSITRTQDSLRTVKAEADLPEPQTINFIDRSIASAEISDVLLPSDEGSRGTTLKQLVDAEVQYPQE